MKSISRAPKRTAWVAALAICALAITVAPAAQAETGTSRLTFDWERLSDVLRGGQVALFAKEQARARQQLEPTEQKFFGLSPHLSLIARDWGGALPLLGPTVLTDVLRLARSSRMVVSRVRFTDGRFAPFIQVGLGQWRTDTDLMPVLQHDVEVAVEVGGGFELKLAQRFRLAIQHDCTVLVRDRFEPQNIRSPHLWGAFLAARAEF